MSNKPIHNDALILIAFLRQTKPGQLVPWDEINDVIGCDVRKVGSPRLSTARRVLLREHNIVFRAYKDEDGGRGLLNCDDSNKCDVVSAEVRRMHRSAGRTLQKVASVDESKLTEDEKRQLFVASAQAGATRQFCGTAARKKLASSGSNGPARINFSDTLAMFVDKPQE